VTDPRTIELINLEIDGALDATGRDQLRRLLEADPEARAMSADLHRLAHLLETTPPVEPPADFSAQVAGAVTASKVVPFRTRLGARRFLPLQIAAAVAAGLLVVLLVRPSIFQNVHAPTLQGTMRRVGPGRVTVSVMPAAAGLTAVTIEVPEPAGSIELGFDPNQVAIERIAGSHAAPRTLRAGLVAIERPQPPSIQVVFRRITSSSSHVAVRVNGGSKMDEVNVVLPPLPTN
jgi:hypothetical protein